MVLYNNVTHFYIGMHGRFDAMAARAVSSAKRKYPHIQMIALLVYHPAKKPVHLSSEFDGSIYPFQKPIPPQYAILKANQYMIRTCSHMVFYVRHPGNARNLLEYANKQAQNGRLFIEQI